MGKSLVIAEKPSVQTDLARVLGRELGKFQKKGKDRNSYFENDAAVISSAVGHLVELKMPEGPNGKKLPWGIKYLPVIPDRFELQPIEKSESRLNLLLRLIRRKDVELVVNACDAGREGELIFRYIMALAGVDKPLQRMWMQSMTDGAIVTAFNRLREDQQMMPLADAAMCRSESDWLVGLNGSRALTAFNSRHGGFNMTTAGRVQTPTLVILAEREREIRNFKERDYWEVHADFKVAAGTYSGRWFREGFKKPDDDDQARAERLWTEAEATTIVGRCTGQTGVVEENKKPSKQIPPQLFDLTTLQREAGSKFGFSARNTLGIAQALYDRHKLLTYPRTDSKCLPEDYIGTVREHLQSFAKANPSATLAQEAINGAAKVLAKDWLQPNKRIFNNAKISDHFAIIPTGKLPGAGLKEQEQKIFDLVLRRLVAIFFPPAEFENTRRITRVNEDSFLTTGKILVVPGYLEVYGRKPGVAAAKDELVPAETGEEAPVVDLETKAEQTKPPARYTEATLLSAMETAGKRVDDEELREA
ncbi:MAG: DNA topoisomerase, partial [Verrucomicrobiota bacterium]|nr:DNA topoisomerase [Verrucomicrobiota bacterium]